MDPFKSIEAWYSSVCNGDWEHTYGITIETLDNPGWDVSIDLAETPLELREFNTIEKERSEDNWIRCCIDNRIFKGYGGINNLHEIISIFTEWASKAE